jgi:hypothetical protein
MQMNFRLRTAIPFVYSSPQILFIATNHNAVNAIPPGRRPDESKQSIAKFKVRPA